MLHFVKYCTEIVQGLSKNSLFTFGRNCNSFNHTEVDEVLLVLSIPCSCTALICFQNVAIEHLHSKLCIIPTTGVTRIHTARLLRLNKWVNDQLKSCSSPTVGAKCWAICKGYFNTRIFSFWLTHSPALYKNLSCQRELVISAEWWDNFLAIYRP